MAKKYTESVLVNFDLTAENREALDLYSEKEKTATTQAKRINGIISEWFNKQNKCNEQRV
jgi:hypothetical protein